MIFFLNSDSALFPNFLGGPISALSLLNLHEWL